MQVATQVGITADIRFGGDSLVTSSCPPSIVPALKVPMRLKTSMGPRKCAQILSELGQKRPSDPVGEVSRQSSSSSKICFHQTQIAGVAVSIPVPTQGIDSILS